MINPKCDGCHKELDKFGALLFSPPVNNIVIKNHLCEECFQKIIQFMFTINSKN